MTTFLLSLVGWWMLLGMVVSPMPRQPVNSGSQYDLPTEQIYHREEPHDCRRWAYTDAFGVCVWLGNLDEPPAWLRK